jgi:hypothetical protein
MHAKVIGADGWSVVRKMARAGITSGWVLAGGTGLALQLGHRISRDLDFFRGGRFDPEGLIDALARLAPVKVHGRSAGALHVALGRTRVSFLSAQAPLLFPGTAYRGLVVADPRDIAVMKVVAIGGRGSRRDFIDLYFYFRSGGSLERVFDMIRRRFAGVDFNDYHLLRSLTFFADAEKEPMPRMLRPVAWPDVKRSIELEVRRLA